MIRTGSKVFQATVAQAMPSQLSKLGSINTAGGSGAPPASLSPVLPPNLWYEGGVLWAMQTPGGANVPQPILTPFPIAFDTQNAFRQCMLANNQTAGTLQFPQFGGPFGPGFQTATLWLMGKQSYACCFVAAVLNMAQYVNSFLTFNAIGSYQAVSTAAPVVAVSLLANVTASSPGGPCSVQPTLVLIAARWDLLASQGLIGAGF